MRAKDKTSILANLTDEHHKCRGKELYEIVRYFFIRKQFE